MKNIKIEFTNERIIPASGLAVVGAILGKSDFVKHCNRMDVTTLYPSLLLLPKIYKININNLL